MKQKLALIGFLILVWILTTEKSKAEETPSQTSYVNDFAELLSPETQKNLEILLEDFEAKTSQQLLAATFQTHGDEPMESFTNRIAQEWKIGYKNAGKEAIFVIFEKEHRAWIEVGSGLEDRIPFNLRRKLVRDKIAPHFRNGEYDAGTLDTIRYLIRAIEPEYEFPTLTSIGFSWTHISIIATGIFACLVVLFFYFKHRNVIK